ncbi:MAG: Jag N-terminal domain-containing protein [Schwartzia sp.]|nr:Jag N-terminal domain-containing protein [Schwartzia sp. (in: firmicutes)]
MALFEEATGKTIEEAKEAALGKLGVREEEAVIEVIEEASKGFLGLIGGHDAKVRATLKTGLEEEPKQEGMPEVIETSVTVGELVRQTAEPADEKKAGEREERVRMPLPDEEDCVIPLEKAEKFLQQIFESMHLEVSIEKVRGKEAYVLNLTGESLGILIGKHGQTLDSLQYLTNLAANHGLSEKRVHIVLDIEHYRDRREETLCRLAARLADKAVRTRQRIMLEPMNRHERKVIHVALQNNRRVTTFSSGEEPYRKVVIEPNRERRGGYRNRRAAEE